MKFPYLDSVKREAFVVALFRSNPHMSVSYANEVFKKRFGNKMSVRRVSEIKKNVANLIDAVEQLNYLRLHAN